MTHANQAIYISYLVISQFYTWKIISFIHRLLQIYAQLGDELRKIDDWQ